MKSITLFIAVRGGLCPAVFAQQPSPEYEIRFDRPLKPNDQLKESVQGERSQEVRTSANGKPLQETKDDFRVEYAATRTVLAVDEIGRATNISDVVEQLVLIRGD